MITGLMLACAVAAAGEITFTKAPAAKKAGGPSTGSGQAKTVIEFAVSEPTDVAVFILNSNPSTSSRLREDATARQAGQGARIVRHLAAGVLGPNAPEPFKKNSLEQSLEWDGKDDRGKVVPKGFYTVKVGLGTEAKFDRFIGFTRQWIGNIYAMACDHKGLVYAYCSRGLVVLDRQGKVLRQIAPAPAGFPAEKLAGLKPVTLKDGSTYFQRSYAFPGKFVASMGITPGGQLLLPGPARYARNLTKIGIDGSVPADAFDTRLTMFSDIGFLHVTASPDGKYAYVSGAEAGYKGDDGRKVVYRHSVYRLKLHTKGPWENFIGDDENGGIGGGYSAEQPKGLTCDAKGNLYVCRYRAGDIVVYDPAGGAIKSFKVEAPHFVAVHPGTGQVYCLAGKEKGYKKYGYDYPATMAEARLVRFSADGKVEQTLKLEDPWELKRKERAGPSYKLSMAADFSGKHPLIWVGVAHPTFTRKWNLLRIEDLGETFGQPREIMPKPDDELSRHALILLYDRKRDLLYHHGHNKLYRYTGDGKKLPFLKFIDPKDNQRVYLCEAALDPDGNICVLGRGQWKYQRNRIVKFTPEGKWIELPDAKEGVPFTHAMKGAGPSQTRGFTVAPNGDIYAMYYDDKFPGKKDLVPWDRSYPLRIAVARISASGKMLNPRLIAHLRAGAGGLRVDGKGNIYAGDNVLPPGVAYPWDFTGVLPDPLEQPYVGRRAGSQGLDPLLRNMGSLFKFGPRGGTIAGLPATDEVLRNKRPVGDLHKPSPELQWFLFRNQRLRVTGAKWQFHGFAPVPGQYHGVTHVEQCICLAGRFDLDEFGRIFVPDTLRKRITVLDSAGNVVLRFGRPGNLDSTGEDMAFAAPWWVAASSDRVFVSDRSLWRIVRVRLESKTSAESKVDL